VNCICKIRETFVHSETGLAPFHTTELVRSSGNTHALYSNVHINFRFLSRLYCSVFRGYHHFRQAITRKISCKRPRPFPYQYFYATYVFILSHHYTINKHCTWYSLGSVYWLDDRAIQVWSPAETKKFSSNLCVQTGSGAHLASCPMCTVGKARTGRDSDHSI
jgi:hypothetical protein